MCLIIINIYKIITCFPFFKIITNNHVHNTNCNIKMVLFCLNICFPITYLTWFINVELTIWQQKYQICWYLVKCKLFLSLIKFQVRKTLWNTSFGTKCHNEYNNVCNDTPVCFGQEKEPDHSSPRENIHRYETVYLLDGFSTAAYKCI